MDYPRQAGDSGAGEDERRVLRAMQRVGAVPLHLAYDADQSAGGGEAGAAAAHRVLSEQMRLRLSWPPDAMYVQMAERYARDGRHADAELLRRMAEVGPRLAEEGEIWDGRYSYRPLTLAEVAAEMIREAGLLAFDQSQTRVGADGAVYETGSVIIGMAAEPVLIVDGRGTGELVRGWASRAAMDDWVNRRSMTGTGALTAAPVPDQPRCYLEDIVLARFLRNPAEAREAGKTLLADTMTTDVRYEVYAAMQRLAAGGEGWYAPELVVAEASARLGYVPVHGLAYYGGEGGPLLSTYLARLGQTTATRGEARDAIEALVARDEDMQIIAGMPTTPEQEAQRPGEQSPEPGADGPELPPDSLPGIDLDGPSGPVQGR